MIREWQRHQSSSAKPSGNLAKRYAVGQRTVRRRRCEGKGGVAVRPTQRFEPTSGMKDRSLRVIVKKIFPPFISRRINLVNVHFGVTCRQGLCWRLIRSKNRRHYRCGRVVTRHD